MNQSDALRGQTSLLIEQQPNPNSPYSMTASLSLIFALISSLNTLYQSLNRRNQNHTPSPSQALQNQAKEKDRIRKRKESIGSTPTDLSLSPILGQSNT